MVEIDQLKVPLYSKLCCSYCYCLHCAERVEHCAEFDSGRSFSHLSAEGGKFLCAHLKFELNACTYEQDFVTSRLVLKPVIV